MKKYINEDIIKIIISILLFTISFFIKVDFIKLVILVISYLIISYEMYIESFKNIKEGEIFDENLLMIIATIGAFFIHNYTEAVLVIILYQIGEYLSDLAVDKSKKSITKLMDLRVEKINLEINNEIKVVKIENVKIGDIFVVRPGEKVPLDGIVIEGESYVDTSSLTGESVPRKVRVNDNVLSGVVNKDCLLKIKATSTYKTSTSQKIIELIENSNNKKSKTEKFITRFAKIYTPTVVIIAFLLVLIPTFLGYDFQTWLYRALVFLVTSCPCALVISVPLGYFCGIGKLSHEGVIVKGSKELENLCDIDYIMLDKTGTITEGIFGVSKIKSKIKEEEFLKIVASAEKNSIHPISKAIEKKYNGKLYEIEKYKEIAGKGISCLIDNKQVLVGNTKLLDDNKIKYEKQNEVGTIIYLSVDEEYKGYLVISDKIKESSMNIKELENTINKEIIILSGDNENIVKDISNKLKIKKYYGNLLPIDKVNYVEKYKRKGKVMFVGDGINDAPVIKLSDIGVSMGNIGSDAAIEASDIVLMNDNLNSLNIAISIARLTNRKVKESIVFALIVKFIVLVLAAFGKTSIILAVFADVGVTFISILNVLTIFIKKIK